jgi:hypothetical protein
MNDKGLADAKAANPFRLPRLHQGNGSLGWARLEPLAVIYGAGGAVGGAFACSGLHQRVQPAARAAHGHRHREIRLLALMRARKRSAAAAARASGSA